MRFPRECTVRRIFVTCFFSLALNVLSTGYGVASPRSSALLSLVPPGADMVAGFENHPGPTKHGRLLLTTHNNRLDLDDWQSLTGVDNNRAFEEVIEVATSDSEGNLSEHLLLVEGRFDRERIFHSLEESGAPSADVEGQGVLLIQPLARERGDMLDTRLLVILENRIGILGTPLAVRSALRRYADHAVPDSVLEERLSLLRSDVTSWNVLSRSAQTGTQFIFAHPHTAWTELQEETDLLMVGARFGSKVRLNFSIFAKGEHDPGFFTRKVAVFADAVVVGATPEAATPETALHRPAKYSLEADGVRGSLEMTSEQFEQWCEYLIRVRRPATALAARGD